MIEEKKINKKDHVVRALKRLTWIYIGIKIYGSVYKIISSRFSFITWQV